MAPTISVFAATGTLGNALAHDLRKLGWNVNALVRNPDAPLAKGLATVGVNLIQGSWNDEEAIKAAVEGCDGIFLNMQADLANPTTERHQGESILAISMAVGVKHVIYSSGLALDDPSRLPGYDPNSFVATMIASKTFIENRTRTIGFPVWTILRPGYFMANWFVPKVAMHPGLVEDNTFTTALKKDTILPLVDEHDIASFAIAAFKDPAKYNGKEIEVASEEQTVEETLKNLSVATGRDFKVVYLSDEEIEAQKATSFTFSLQMIARHLSQYINMENMKNSGIKLHTFKEYLEREKKLAEKTYGKK